MEIAPTHEEQARLLVHYEVKSGEQVAHAGPVRLETWSKQAKLFAERQTPRKKWAVVLSYPNGRKRLWMDFDQWLSLVAEIMESH